MRLAVRPFAALVFGLVVAASAAQSAPGELEVRREVERLDAALAQRDVEAYLQRFRPEQPFLHEQHAHDVRARFAAGVTARTALRLTACAPMGEHAIAILAMETFAGESTTATSREHVMLVLRLVDGAVRPVLAAEVPEPDFDPRSVVCPYCNYAVGPAEGWLAVPVATSRTAAVEGTVFVHLGSDLAVEVLVQIADRPQDATEFVAPLRERMLAATGATATPVVPFAPATFALGVAGTSAASARIDFADARLLELRAVAMGRLAHLFLVRGSKQDVERRSPDLDRLFASYRLLSVEAKTHEQAAQAIDHHCGGLLRERVYENARHGVRIDGPEGFQGLERCSGFLFEVEFRTDDHGARVRLRGLAPPPGAMTWTEAGADRWLADLCVRGRTRIDTAHDTGWQPAARGFSQRTLRLSTTDATERELRLLLRRDQLVVVDGSSKDTARLEAMRASVRSLAPLP